MTRASHSHRHHHHHHHHHRHHAGPSFHSHRRHHGYGGGGGGSINGPACAKLCLLLLLAGSAACLGYSASYMPDEIELMEASKGIRRNCTVTSVGSVANDGYAPGSGYTQSFTLAYTAPPCSSVWRQRVPVGPFSPQGNPVGSTLACYSVSTSCAATVVVYQIDQFSLETALLFGFGLAGTIMSLVGIGAYWYFFQHRPPPLPPLAETVETAPLVVVFEPKPPSYDAVVSSSSGPVV